MAQVRFFLVSSRHQGILWCVLLLGLLLQLLYLFLTYDNINPGAMGVHPKKSTNVLNNVQITVKQDQSKLRRKEQSNIIMKENKVKTTVQTTTVRQSLLVAQSNNVSLTARERIVRDYISYIEQYCLVHLTGSTSSASKLQSDLPLCSCKPPKFDVNLRPNESPTSLTDVETLHPELGPGGVWQPHDCVARQRIAIIVPYRDRPSHLAVFLRHIHPILQSQKIVYRIFVIEQVAPEVFNKGAIMNAGFLEMSRRFRFDCVIFHDVDMLPEDNRNMYTCRLDHPSHLSPYVSKYAYTVGYDSLFGGVIAFTKHQFASVNGFSNHFFGWGGEDDDMFNRLRARKYYVWRPPRAVARYKMIKHGRDKGNPHNWKSSVAYRYRPAAYRMDGLSHIKKKLYTLVALENHRLFTHIQVALNFTRSNFSEYNKAYEYTQKTGYDCPGHQVARFKLSLDHCKARCDLMDQCQAFVWLVTPDKKSAPGGKISTADNSSSTTRDDHHSGSVKIHSTNSKISEEDGTNCIIKNTQCNWVVPNRKAHSFIKLFSQ